MKTIRKNRIRAMRVRCEHCGSRLRVDPKDIQRHPSTDAKAYFICPECDRENYFNVGPGFWARLRATLK